MELDKRYKYRLHQKLPYYIYVRDRRNGIFYVRYKDGTTLSTGETSLQKACNFAQAFFYSHQKRDKNTQKLQLKTIIQEYYKKGSTYTEYDIKHGTNYTDKILKFNDGRMQKVAELLSDVVHPEDLTRNRLIQLQEQLLDMDLSGKTVNNYFSILHKIFNQLLDKEIIKIDPFLNLRPCSFKKELRLCFPLEHIKGAFNTCNNKYELLAFVACATGMRRGEIERVQSDDFILKNNTEWLKVRGTKTVYSVRDVPVFTGLKDAILRMLQEKYSAKDYMKCVQVVAQKIGFNSDYVQQNGIKFHSFRKLYKTLLTQANLNTTLIESLMGHTTQNQMSNDVERIYFVAESADLSKVHKKVTDELQYLV